MRPRRFASSQRTITDFRPRRRSVWLLLGAFALSGLVSDALRACVDDGFDPTLDIDCEIVAYLDDHPCGIFGCLSVPVLGYTTAGGVAGDSCEAAVELPRGGVFTGVESVAILDASSEEALGSFRFRRLERGGALRTNSPNHDWTVFEAPLSGPVRPGVPVILQFVLFIHEGATLAQVLESLTELTVGTIGSHADGSVGHFSVVRPSVDVDSDGVLDPGDACPLSDTSDFATFESCGVRARNVVFEDGCTVADRIASCEAFLGEENIDACLRQLVEELPRGAVDPEELADLEACLGAPSPGKLSNRSVQQIFVSPGSAPGLCDVHVFVRFELRDGAGTATDLGVEVDLFDGAQIVEHGEISALFPASFGVACAGPGCGGECGTATIEGVVATTVCVPTEPFVCACTVRREIVFPDLVVAGPLTARIESSPGSEVEDYLLDDSATLAAAALAEGCGLAVDPELVVEILVSPTSFAERSEETLVDRTVFEFARLPATGVRELAGPERGQTMSVEARAGAGVLELAIDVRRGDELERSLRVLKTGSTIPRRFWIGPQFTYRDDGPATVSCEFPPSPPGAGFGALAFTSSGREPTDVRYAVDGAEGEHVVDLGAGLVFTKRWRITPHTVEFDSRWTQAGELVAEVRSVSLFAEPVLAGGACNYGYDVEDGICYCDCAAPPPPPPEMPLGYRGFAHRPLGDAELRVEDDRLVVDNIGASGEDGVVVEFGPAEGFGLCFDAALAARETPDGTFLGVEIADADDVLLGRIDAVDIGDAFATRVDYFEGDIEIVVLRGGELVGSASSDGGMPVYDLEDDFAPECVRTAVVDRGACVMFCWPRLAEPVRIRLEGEVVLGDCLLMIARNGRPLETGDIQSMRLRSAGVSARAIADEDIVLFGNAHRGRGDAMLRPTSERTLSASFGDTGGGVAIARADGEPFARFDLQWAPIEPSAPRETSSLALGVVLDLDPTGAGGPPSEPETFWAIIRRSEVGIRELSADFRALGADTYAVVLLDDGEVVATLRGQSAAARGLMLEGWPRGASGGVLTADATGGLYADAFGVALDFDDSTPASIGAATGDRIALVAELPPRAPEDEPGLPGFTAYIDAVDLSSLEILDEDLSPLGALDIDGDGVPHADDRCPFSNTAPNVAVGRCPDQPNIEVAPGCTLADALAPCGSILDPVAAAECYFDLFAELEASGVITGADRRLFSDCTALDPEDLPYDRVIRSIELRSLGGAGAPYSVHVDTAVEIFAGARVDRDLGWDVVIRTASGELLAELSVPVDVPAQDVSSCAGLGCPGPCGDGRARGRSIEMTCLDSATIADACSCQLVCPVDWAGPYDAAEDLLVELRPQPGSLPEWRTNGDIERVAAPAEPSPAILANRRLDAVQLSPVPGEVDLYWLDTRIVVAVHASAARELVLSTELSVQSADRTGSGPPRVLWTGKPVEIIVRESPDAATCRAGEACGTVDLAGGVAASIEMLCAADPVVGASACAAAFDLRAGPIELPAREEILVFLRPALGAAAEVETRDDIVRCTVGADCGPPTRPTAVFRGNVHTALGDARLSYGPDRGGMLTVSNIGSSGEDGVLIELAPAGEFGLSLRVDAASFPAELLALADLEDETGSRRTIGVRMERPAVGARVEIDVVAPPVLRDGIEAVIFSGDEEIARSRGTTVRATAFPSGWLVSTRLSGRESGGPAQTLEFAPGTGVELDGVEYTDVSVRYVAESGDGAAAGGADPFIVEVQILAGGISSLDLLDEITTSDPAAPVLRRGDANNDGTVDISDGVGIVNRLFLGGAPFACDDAADSNDDGGIDISDAIKIFGFLFLGETDPPAPGASICGPDPSDDPLGCERSVCP